MQAQRRVVLVDDTERLRADLVVHHGPVAEHSGNVRGAEKRQSALIQQHGIARIRGTEYVRRREAEHVPALLGGKRSRYQRAALFRRLEHDCRTSERGKYPVPLREVSRMRSSTGRVLADENASRREYLIAESEVLARVVDIDSAAENSSGRSALRGSRHMRGYVHADRKAAHDNDALFCELAAYPVSDPQAVIGRLACSDGSYRPRARQAADIARVIEYCGRIHYMSQLRRIVLRVVAHRADVLPAALGEDALRLLYISRRNSIALLLIEPHQTAARAELAVRLIGSLIQRHQLPYPAAADTENHSQPQPVFSVVHYKPPPNQSFYASGATFSAPT